MYTLKGHKPKPRRINYTLLLGEAGCYVSHRDMSVWWLASHVSRSAWDLWKHGFCIVIIVSTMICKRAKDRFLSNGLLSLNPIASTSSDGGGISCKSEIYLWAWKALRRHVPDILRLRVESCTRILISEVTEWDFGWYEPHASYQFRRCHISKTYSGSMVHVLVYNYMHT